MEQLSFLEIFEFSSKFGSNLKFKTSGKLVNKLKLKRGRGSQQSSPAAAAADASSLPDASADATELLATLSSLPRVRSSPLPSPLRTQTRELAPLSPLLPPSTFRPPSNPRHHARPRHKLVAQLASP